MTQEEYIEHIDRFKVIFVGDAGTGKTSFINRIIENEFNEYYEPSIGVDFMSKNVRFKGNNIRIQIWDTSGQEKYKGLIPSYIRNSSIVFIIYDVSNRTSFENIPKWIDFVKSIENTTLILLGNKIDLNRKVETNEGKKLAKDKGILFFESNAKSNENIKKIFLSSLVEVLPIFEFNSIDEKKKN